MAEKYRTRHAIILKYRSTLSFLLNFSNVQFSGQQRNACSTIELSKGLQESNVNRTQLTVNVTNTCQ